MFWVEMGERGMSRAFGRMSSWLLIKESKNSRLTGLVLLKKPQHRPQENKEPAWW